MKKYILYIGRSILAHEESCVTIGITDKKLLPCREYQKVMETIHFFELPSTFNTVHKAEYFERTKIQHIVDREYPNSRAFVKFNPNEMKECPTTGRTWVWWKLDFDFYKEMEKAEAYGKLINLIGDFLKNPEF